MTTIIEFYQILFFLFLVTVFQNNVSIVRCHSVEDINLKSLSPNNFEVQFNPFIKLWTSPTTFEHSGDLVTVAWEGVPRPTKKDFVAVYAPAEALDRVGTGGFETAPVQYQFADVSTTHLDEGFGSIKFQFLNLREDFVVGFFTGGIHHPVLVAKSEPIENLNPNEISNVHLAFIGGGSADMRVTWVTRDAESPMVQWKEAGQSLEDSDEGLWSKTSDFNTAGAESRTFSREDLCGAPSNSIGFHSPGEIHSAVMTGLQPNTQYVYRVGDAELGLWSEVKMFATVPKYGSKEAVRFAVFGDMGTAMPDGSLDHVDFKEQKAALGTMQLIQDRVEEPFSHIQWPHSTQRVLQTGQMRKGLDFVLHIGDISYAVGYATHWDEFLHQIEGVASQVPWMVGIGNHERDSPNTSDIRNESSFYTGTDSGGECGVPYAAYFPMPEPATDYQKDTPWYSFDYGPVHITVMSTEHDFFEGSKQYKWIENDLKSINRRSIPWAILAGHRPMYVDSDWIADLSVATQLRSEIEPLMMKYKVNVGLYGHHHSYQRTCQVYNQRCLKHSVKDYESFVAPVQLVVGMAGYDLSTTSQLVTPKWIEYVDKKSHGMAFLTANTSSLYFEFIESENRKVKVDEFWLTIN